MTDSALVFPGDEVAIAEEFLPGPGTYEENGTVYAARMGRLKLDTNQFTAMVEAVTSVPLTLNVGDIIIGTIESIRSSMAIVAVQKVAADADRAVAGDTNGTLHVARTAEYYLERLEDAFRMKDIVRAEVTQVTPSVQLTTRAPHLGVLKAYCPRDRVAMTRAVGSRAGALVCPECDWKMTGKLAEDYGEGRLVFAGEIRESPPQERGGGRGGPGRGGRDFGGRSGGRGFGGRGGRERGSGGGRGFGGRGRGR